MRETELPPRSPRRVGVYERLRRSEGSPAKMIAIGAVAFIILVLIVIMLMLMR